MSGKPDPRRSFQAGVSNNLGHTFEDAIKQGCAVYAQRGRAKIDKTPEPFWVMEKKSAGVFTGRFTAHAQPDFQGTLDGGRSIIFEAKYTVAGRMKRNVLTDNQMAVLEDHHRKGALAGVCVGIQSRFFFVPWPVWRDMKKLTGRVSVTADDLAAFEVKFNGAVLFLDYLGPARGPWIEGRGCNINRWREKSC
ncbi:MAG: Holliday junction resolvase RecU [Muribaculaceae bacterium]|nr:Holliday junction resolvase RecU [Muribaculaceae bacterium]MCM1439673.1 Holliday junction resolvase RecU [Roseburia sp.]